MEASHKNSETFTEPEPELLHRDITRGGSHDAADPPPPSKDNMIIFVTMNPIKQVLTKKEEENERANSS